MSLFYNKFLLKNSLWSSDLQGYQEGMKMPYPLGLLRKGGPDLLGKD